MASHFHNPLHLEINARSLESLSLVANIDTASGQHQRRQQQQISAAHPAQVYQSAAELMYSVLRLFLPEPSIESVIQEIARMLAIELPRSGYERYARLLCLRLVYERLRRDERAKPPSALTRNSTGEPIELSIEQSFSFILRDRFNLSCLELAAIMSSSEGSIRTRLERTRIKLFPIDTPRSSKHSAADSSLIIDLNGHACFHARLMIEDFDIAMPQLGQLTIPSAVTNSVAGCSHCNDILLRRKSALSLASNLLIPPLPDQLKSFPLTPLFMKDGERVLLNWTAAPWYVKALFEGLLATTLVLGIILSIPRIKGIYEFWLERRLDLYSIAELATNLGRTETAMPTAGTTGNAKVSATAETVGSKNISEENQLPNTSPALVQSSNTNDKHPSTNANATEPLAVKAETEFGTRDSEVASSDKIYRILIKTDSPETLKEQVLRSLSTVHFTSADEESPLGADLPGGVMFDVIIPLKSYKQIVNELHRIGETRVIITRSKERGVAGKAHLKIWLQRI